MKQTYRRSDLSGFRKKIFVALAIVIAGVFILAVTPLRTIVSHGAYRIAPYLWNAGNTAADTGENFFESFASKRSLAEENDRLRKEVARMQTQVLDRNLLEEKVIAMEESLGRAGSDDRVVARVLAGPGRSPYDTLVVDAGEEQGIERGDYVAYAGAGVIGTIDEVYSWTAKVKLFSFPGEQTPVLAGEQAVPGTAEGRGMGNFEVRIPRGSPVLAGDMMMIPGKSLILGIVGAVIENDALPFMRVLFTTPFNIAEIQTVEILKTAHY